jgi:hypothetical protein
MNDSINARIEELRADYTEMKGQPFSYFYCPILFRDEDAVLCKAIEKDTRMMSWPKRGVLYPD